MMSVRLECYGADLFFKLAHTYIFLRISGVSLRADSVSERAISQFGTFANSALAQYVY
jgi:hypothetical protein